MAGFNNFFQKKLTKKTENTFEESKDSMMGMTGEMKALNEKKNNLKEQMTPQVFDYYYKFLSKRRADPSTDEAKLRSELKSMMGNNKEL